MTPLNAQLLRRYALARSLFRPTTLPRALATLAFVQADPIRAPARAQDLTLRHRVAGYRAGDLERRYPRLAVEEDFFVNYGFVTRELRALMHPRKPRLAWPAARQRQAQAVLAFIRERGAVHPRQVDAHFQHGRTTNWFGGSSNASTQLLDGMHYRGLLRVARRDSGVRVYEACDAFEPPRGPADCRARMDALVDAVVRKYAPLPAASLGGLLSLLCGGVPQWRADRLGALVRARQRLARARVDAADWYWPADEDPLRWARRFEDDASDHPGRVRLLAPFDPVVWDRRRFECFWGWPYRFEAYTPPARRRLGYYALPLLWGEQVIGWANVQARDGTLDVQPSFVSGVPPRARPFRAAFDDEVQRLRAFLGL